jgi:carboxypeptidase C (cathepsin A)
MQGSRLSAGDRKTIAAKLARYTGLSEEYVLATNLRVNIRRFVKELRRDERITVGRLDSRFKGKDIDAAGEGYEFDPSYAAIQGPFTAAANDYFRTELGYENDLAYEILTGRVRPWNYSNVEGRYLNVAETLREAMAQNPHLDVFVANGYYDLATPYFATQYTFDHLSMDTDYTDRVTMTFSPAGHMMYIQKDSLARLKQSLVAFYARTLAR